MANTQLKEVIKQLVDESENNSLLNYVKAILQGEAQDDQEYDWWDDLTPEQQAQVEIGLQQAEQGLTIPHEQVMREARELIERKRKNK